MVAKVQVGVWGVRVWWLWWWWWCVGVWVWVWVWMWMFRKWMLGWEGGMGWAHGSGRSTWWQSVVAVEVVEVEVLHTAIQYSIQYASRHNPVCGTSKGRQGSFCVSAGTLTARIVKIDGDQREPRTGAYILVLY